MSEGKRTSMADWYAVQGELRRGRRVEAPCEERAYASSCTNALSCLLFTIFLITLEWPQNVGREESGGVGRERRGEPVCGAADPSEVDVLRG